MVLVKATSAICPLKNLTPVQILTICKIVDGDGHTIFPPEAFTKKKIPREVIESEIRFYKSDISDPKSTIFNNQGQALLGLDGIYGLSLLKHIASAFDVEYEGKMGRGWEARSVTESLIAHFMPLAYPPKKGGKRVRKVARLA